MAEIKKVKGSKPETVAPLKMLPSLYLTDDDVIDGLSIGDEVTLTVKAKVVGLHESKSRGEDGESKSRLSQDLEITCIEKGQDTPKAKFGRTVTDAAKRAGR